MSEIVQKDFEQSDSLDKLAPALSKLQGGLENVKRDSANPFFKSKYSTLTSVWDEARAKLQANGFSLIQAPLKSSQGVILKTMLLHSSGQFIASTFFMPVEKISAQDFGKAITYARRYCMCSVLGIAPDDDDDGNTAQYGTNKMKLRQEPKDTNIRQSASAGSSGASHSQNPNREGDLPAFISESKQKALFEQSKKAGWPLDEFKEWVFLKTKKESLKDLIEEEYEKLSNSLGSKPWEVSLKIARDAEAAKAARAIERAKESEKGMR